MKKRFKEIKDWKGVLLMLFIFFGAIAFIGFTSAAPTKFSGTSTMGIDIEHPIADPIKVGEMHKFHFHIFNSSTGIPIKADKRTANCTFHLYNSTGSHIFKVNDVVSSDDIYDYEQIILGGNFTNPGQYSYVFQCNTSSSGGYYTNYFQVTPTGDDRGFGLFLVLLGCALLFFLGGYILDQDWLVFLSGILWITVGIYTMIYGVGDLTDLYTRSIAGVTIAIGLVFIVAAIFNISKGGSNSDDSFSEE